MRTSFVVWISIVIFALGAPATAGDGFALENGDVNGDMSRDVSDVSGLLAHIFLGGRAPVPLADCAGLPVELKNGDVNADRSVDLSDGIALLGWLFLGAGEPSPACGWGAGGANANPRVIPPGATAFGGTYGDWGAAWQQWCFYQTTGQCAVTDNTGEFAHVAQEGKVFFLAGTFGELPGTPWAAPNPVHRTVTIPADVALCLPINNWGLIYPEDVMFTGAPPDATFEEALPYMYEALNGAYDGIDPSRLLCEVDGVALKNLENYRAQSEPFQIYSPASNVQNDLMTYFMGYPFVYAEGWHPAVADGYYAMLPPLSAGSHKIHLTTLNWDLTVFCDVYYDLTVKGGK